MMIVKSVLRTMFSSFSVAVLTSMSVPAAIAQEKSNLGNDATNPAAPLIQLQLQDSLTPDTYGLDGVANAFIVQPVYPIILGPDHYFQSIITRTTVPLVTTAKLPKPGGGTKSHTDLGDTVFLAVPAHKEDIGPTPGDFFTWAPVGATTIPTATSKFTGSDKWSVGPGLFLLRGMANVFTDGDAVQVGALAYQQWSIAGKSSRPDVSKIFLQPVVNYHFASLFNQKGWYAGLPDDLSNYNWEAKQWGQIPVGARLGRVFHIGNQPINLFGQGWWNAANNRPGGSKYTLKANLTFLFPQ